MTSPSSQAAALVAAQPTLHRTGTVSLLSQQWPALSVTLTADMSQVVELIRIQSFQLLILNDYLSGKTLLTLLHTLRQARPMQKVVVLTANISLLPTTTTSHLLIPRHSAPTHIAVILYSLLQGTSHYHYPTHAPHLIQTRFSACEFEVLRLVIEDYCNLAVVAQLYLSVRTVESHLRALLQKSGTRN